MWGAHWIGRPRHPAAVGRGAAHLFKASWGPMNVRRRFLRGGRPVANEIGTPVPNTVNRRPQLFPLGGKEPEQKYAFVQRKFGFLTEMGATVYRGLCPRTPAGGVPRTPLVFCVLTPGMRTRKSHTKIAENRHKHTPPRARHFVGTNTESRRAFSTQTGRNNSKTGGTWPVLTWRKRPAQIPGSEVLILSRRGRC